MEIVDYLLARKKAGGGSDVTIEQLNVTENGTYSEQGIAYSPVVVNVPAPENSYQLTDIPTGAVSTIEDGTDLPMSSLKVGIEPAQDLHGYDHPWAEGTGKNKLQVTGTSQTINDVTFTVNDDGTIKVNGTATANVKFVIGEYILKAGSSVRFNGSPVDGSTSTIALGYQGYGIVSTANSDRVYDRASASTDWDNDVYISVTSGYTADNLTFKPMIRLASEQDATFEPYSNICPISGWTAANVTRTGKNLCTIFTDGKVPSISTGELVTAGGARSDFVKVLPSTNYIFSVESPAQVLYIFYYDINKNFIEYYSNRTGLNITHITPSNCYYCMIRTGANADAIEKPQLELGSTATTYEPYNDTTYTIEFKDGDNPLTVYGGTLDVISGLLTVTDAYIASYNGETLPSTWISDRDVYAVGITPTTGAEVVYKLANSATYQLTPTQVRTLVGNNNIWADTGDVLSGKYFKEL